MPPGRIGCVVSGCGNGQNGLSYWASQFCDEHGGLKKSLCSCAPPFALHSFPREPSLRAAWLRALGLNELPFGARVCSYHAGAKALPGLREKAHRVRLKPEPGLAAAAAAATDGDHAGYVDDRRACAVRGCPVTAGRIRDWGFGFYCPDHMGSCDCPPPTLHSRPKDATLARLWTEILAGESVGELGFVVCSRHFIAASKLRVPCLRIPGWRPTQIGSLAAAAGLHISGLAELGAGDPADVAGAPDLRGRKRRPPTEEAAPRRRGRPRLAPLPPPPGALDPTLASMLSILGAEDQSFPRTIVQAHFLQCLDQPSVVIDLDVPFEVIVDRLSKRWIHARSGRIYNLDFNPPKKAGVDDVTGEPLVQREDDQAKTVLRRLETYHQWNGPLADYYEGLGILRRFKGESSNAIWPQLFSYMERHAEPLKGMHDYDCAAA